MTTATSASDSAVPTAQVPELAHLSPLPWTDFFETKRQVSIPYELDASEITHSLYEIGSDRKDLSKVIVLHHGAAHCALSFAATARELKKLVGSHARIMSLDARGHGETTSHDQTNLHIDRLSQDLENLLLTLYGAGSEEKTAPEIFLVGHSMGGTVVHEVACRKLVPNVSAVAVLDMMESYKIMGLNLIKVWCDQRPPTCATLEHAIQWGIESGTVRNPESARVSFPGMIARAPGSTVYTWHTDLLASQNDWVTWFEGLEQKFINITSPPKLLILGGQGQIEGNMRKAYQDGKFRLMILPQSGHAVEEDEPDKVAKELVDFWMMG